MQIRDCLPVVRFAGRHSWRASALLRLGRSGCLHAIAGRPIAGMPAMFVHGGCRFPDYLTRGSAKAGLLVVLAVVERIQLSLNARALSVMCRQILQLLTQFGRLHSKIALAGRAAAVDGAVFLEFLADVGGEGDEVGILPELTIRSEERRVGKGSGHRGGGARER